MKAEKEITIGGDFTLKELEKAHIEQVMRRTQSYSVSAKILGVDTSTLYRKRTAGDIIDPIYDKSKGGRPKLSDQTESEKEDEGSK